MNFFCFNHNFRFFFFQVKPFCKAEINRKFLKILKKRHFGDPHTTYLIASDGRILVKNETKRYSDSNHFLPDRLDDFKKISHEKNFLSLNSKNNEIALEPALKKKKIETIFSFC